MGAEKKDFPKTRSLFLILIALISFFPIADALTMVDSCQNLVVPGETYALSQNIVVNSAPGETCFPIAVEYVTLDCNGFSIIGNNATGTRGITTSAPNTIIRNCDIRDFETGVILNGGYGSLLDSNVAARASGSYTINSYIYAVSLSSNNNHLSNVKIRYVAANNLGADSQSALYVVGTNNIMENMQVDVDASSVSNYPVELFAIYQNNGGSNTYSNISGSIDTGAGTPAYASGLFIVGDSNHISDINLSQGISLLSGNNFLSGNLISKGSQYFEDESKSHYTLFVGWYSNNLIKNATFICEGTCAGHVGYLASNSNTFCLNNFTDMPGAYVTNIGATGRGGNALESGIFDRNPFLREKIRKVSESGRKAAESAPKDRTETNQFSCMDNGLEQGNIWGNVASGDVIIHGVIPSSVPGFYIGSTPYSAVNSQGKLNGEISDPYPLTPLSAALECGALGEEGETYAMTNNQSSSGTCYTITAADVTLDCNGFSITGNNAPGTYGVYSNQPGTIVKNCIISNFSEGIRYSGSAGSLISNSTISATYASGSAIRITAGSHDSQLINNTITAFDAHGIYVDGGTDVAIDCQDARLLCFNTLENTDVAPYPCNTTHSAYIDCIRYKRLPVRYPGTYGIYTNQPGTSASNCNIDNFAVGIMANGATGASFKYNHVRSAGTRNGGAVVLANGSGNTIGDSILSADTNTGLRMENEHHGEISGNEISGASAALELGGASVGSLISGNTFSCPGNSLVKISAASNGNTFAWNNFTNSGTGFFVEDGGSNAYSAAIDGQNQGNLWGNVLNGSVRIAGAEASTLTDALYIGSAGPGYPYSAATAQGRLYGNVVDEAPLTPSIITNLAIEGGISFEDCPVGHCTVVSASASNTPWREVSASIAASEGACTQILNSMDGNRLDVSYRCSHSTSATPLFNITFDNGIDTVSTAGTHQYPVCFEFAEPNETYFLGSNANAGTSSCFVISAPNVTLDCKGYSIIGSNEPLSKGI
ncbi:MAG: right-handed parallel beta-helix repeat-containing protein, partial [Candidatus Micrarchaeia archaeon]